MEVTIPCPCPPKADGTARHETDTVVLKDTMDFPTAVLLQKTVTTKIVHEMGVADSAGKVTFRLTQPDVMALMTGFCVRNCIEGWTLVDEKGKARPVTVANIEEHLETNLEAALAVADAADEAYSGVMLPLVMRVFNSFLLTRTGGAPGTGESTSQKTSGSPKRPKPSKPSSISTIPTVVTGPTSSLPDGVSSSLPSSATAA